MGLILLTTAEVVNPVGSIVKIENYPPGKLRGTWAHQGGRTYTTALKVQTNSKYVGPIQIIQSVAPSWGAYYRWPLTELGGNSLPALPVERDTGSFLQSIACDPDGEDGKQWILTLEYGPFDVGHEKGESDDKGVTDPLKKPLEVSWGSAVHETDKPEDESDPPKPYLNTVGDPFKDVPKTEESWPILNIVRNEAIYNTSYVSQYKGRVNEDEFLGFPPNSVKCKDITAKREYETDWGYHWEITYEFEIRDDPDGKGWDLEILNAGFRQRLEGVSVPTTIMLNQAPISEEVALTEEGEYDPNAEPFFITFKPYKSISFADFNFPADLLTQVK